VWGGQLGWGDLTPLLEPKHKALCAYFRRLCRLRARHAGLFATGRMLRPPRITLPREAGGETLYASLWQPAPGAAAILFLVNPTGSALRATVHLRTDELPPLKTVQRGSGLELERSDRNGVSYSVALPPRASRAIPLEPLQPTGQRA
jgi:hypothetical protein